LLKYAQETGQTLAELRQNLAHWRAAQEQEAGPSSIAQDLEVLRFLLHRARSAVEQRQGAESAALLTRMSRVARALLAELPGQLVAVRVERALMALGQDSPDVARASAALLAATDVCLGARDAALVPNVVKDLEAARASLSKDPKQAQQQLEAVLAVCGRDEAARWAYFLVQGLTSAFEAVQREAWLVAEAELQQAEELVKKLEAARAGEGQGPPAAAAQKAPETSPPPTGQPTGSLAQPPGEAPASQSPPAPPGAPPSASAPPASPSSPAAPPPSGR
jgi:hypothetical protein